MIFIMRAGQRQGPYTREDLLAALQARKVSLTDFAWHDGDADMLTVSEFLAAPAAPAAPTTPSTPTEAKPSPLDPPASPAPTVSPAPPIPAPSLSPSVPAPPADLALFYVTADSETTEGPYSQRKLRGLWDTGKISHLALYWNEEDQAWRALKELITVPLLRAKVPATAPPAPQKSPPAQPPPLPLQPALTAQPKPHVAVAIPQPTDPARPKPPIAVVRPLPTGAPSDSPAKGIPIRLPVVATSNMTPPPIVATGEVTPLPAAATPDVTPRPWARLFARYLDLQICGFALVLPCAFFSIYLIDTYTKACTIFPLSLGLCEALLLTALGTTPGKWLFGIRVLRSDGGKLRSGAALCRTLAVMLRSTLFTFPFFWPAAYYDLTRKGRTTWDKEFTCQVTNQSRPVIVQVFVTIFVLFSACIWFLTACHVIIPFTSGEATSSTAAAPPEASAPLPTAPPSRPLSAPTASQPKPASIPLPIVIPTFPPPTMTAEPATHTSVIDALTRKCSPYLAIVEGNVSSGTASVISFHETPLIVTNAHVLSGNGIVKIRLISGQELTPSELADPGDRDIIVTDQGELPRGLDASASVDTDVSIGDEVLVLGNSQGSGVVTQITGKVLGIGPNLIETDARFVHGNSGSPIIHVKSGKVIAIATFAETREIDSVSHNTRFGTTRWFGYRIDTIRRWYKRAGSAFLAEGLRVEAIKQRNNELFTLARELSAGNRVTPSRYYSNGWVGGYVEALGSGLINADDPRNFDITTQFRNTENQFLEDFDNDFPNLRTEDYSPYHRDALNKEYQTRSILYNYFKDFDWEDVRSN